jgi:hypothetical protein
MLRFPVLSRFDGISIPKMSFSGKHYLKENKKGAEAPVVKGKQS